ncbi:MAG: DUF58 domain-containing protein [Gammaproteobacteria bacterium]
MNLLRPLTGWIERTTTRRALGTHWPETLERSQVFILPTGFGLLAAVATLVLLMVALNYQNSPVFLLTFLLGALLCTAMVICHRHLRGLVIEAAAAEPVFAGETIHLRISLFNSRRNTRRGLIGFSGKRNGTEITLAPGASGQIELILPPRVRGRHSLQHLGLADSEPFGVFRAWSRLAPLECIVYPLPAAHASPPPGSAEGMSHGEANAEPEDFAELARYRPGDRPGQIAWRAYARSGTLERKHFASGGTASRWLDFDAAPGTDTETRLSIIARWALMAERDGTLWGLHLPQHRIAPGCGSAHLARCLRALALFPGPYDDNGS